ncbi:MAG: type IX secretion system membrane protein PorP/SprF, partial [Cyclobacteriaceae bacterium]
KVSWWLSSLWNAGLYYTYDDAVMLGGAYRQNDIISMTASVKLAKKIMLGYTYEISNGNVNLGSTNEIALRFDFSNYNYQERFREDYKAAVSYRRKALNTRKPGKIGSSNASTAQKKNIKKINSYKSPSARYSNNKKLPNVKRKKTQMRNKRKFGKQRRSTKKRYKKGKR